MSTLRKLVPRRLRVLCTRLAPRWEKKALPESKSFECGCCFDRFHLDQVVHCEGGHPFCRNCLKRYAEAQIGDYKTDIQCMSTAQCPLSFPNAQISVALPKRTFQRLETIRQQTDIRKAALEGFYGCPFCSYGVCIDANECEEDVKKEKAGKAPGLFKCRGKGCRVTSCMSCQRKNHLPKTCAEVSAHWAERHEMEEAKSAALIRNCPGCDISFVRNDGCAMMACNCQHLSCYVCRQTVPPYALPELHGRCQKQVNRIERKNIRDAERGVRRKQRARAKAAKALLGSTSAGAGVTPPLTPGMKIEETANGGANSDTESNHTMSDDEDDISEVDMEMQIPTPVTITGPEPEAPRPSISLSTSSRRGQNASVSLEQPPRPSTSLSTSSRCANSRPASLFLSNWPAPFTPPLYLPPSDTASASTSTAPTLRLSPVPRMSHTRSPSAASASSLSTPGLSPTSITSPISMSSDERDDLDFKTILAELNLPQGQGKNRHSIEGSSSSSGGAKERSSLDTAVFATIA